jgi:SAM-dependent methyltransferase
MFNPAIALAVIKATANKEYKSVCELGNQTARNWEMVNKHHSKITQYSTPQEFYSQLGIIEYTSIDINSYNGSIIADLNKEHEWDVQYDVVTNNGTSEHVFNQHAVFVNMRRLCKVGGVMIHSLPTSYFDHGFYNYNPNLFFSVAKTNNDVYLFGYITHVNGAPDLKIFSADWLTLPTTQRRRWLSDNKISQSNMNVVFASVKTNDDDFKMPIQHAMYADAFETNELKQNYV